MDLDLALRLTEERDALALPVAACLYTMSASDRLTDKYPMDEHRLRAKASGW